MSTVEDELEEYHDIFNSLLAVTMVSKIEPELMDISARNRRFGFEGFGKMSTRIH